MLGASSLIEVLGCGVNNTNHDEMRHYIKALCAEGLSLVLIMPGTKVPFDGRTDRKRRADDKAAKAAAKEAGRRDWAKVKSPSGLALASNKATDFLKKNGYLDEYVRIFGEDCAINLAVEVGRSRLVVVDCDTSEQCFQFLEVCGIDTEQPLPPTVVSPGDHDAEGNMIHDGKGGHFWFTLPDDVEVPDNLGAMPWENKDSFVIMWHNRYVLIPPSTRKEGRYELTGDIFPAPEWMVEAITERAAHRAARSQREADYFDNAIDEWAESITWAEILEPLGWTPSARTDGCGCDVWTAPGVHASPKSATTHDGGCQLGRYTETNAPMHIWTDNPGEPFDDYIERNGTKTLSKLQAVAWSEYGGDIGAAMDEMGLGVELHSIESDQGVSQSNLSDDLTPEDIAVSAQPDQQPAATSPAEPGSEDTGYCVVCDDYLPADQFEQDADGQWWHNPADEQESAHPATNDEVGGEPTDEPSGEFPGEDNDQSPEVFESDVPGVPIIAPPSYWQHLPPPEFIIEGLVEHAALTLVIGPSGIGKSTVALDWACHIAIGKPWHGRKTLKTKVLYLPGEGQRGVNQRLQAWAAAHKVPMEVLDESLRVGDSVVRLAADKIVWATLAEYMIKQRIGLVIYDTFARMSLGIEENSATEVGRAVERFDQMRRLTGAGAIVVHHTGKQTPTVARGSGALTAAVESELLVSDAQWEYSDMAPDLIDENGRAPKGKPIGVSTTKQKNTEQVEGQIPLLLTKYEPLDAALITGINGNVDPMYGDVTLASPVEEPTLETAIRIRAFLDELTEQGATRADIVSLVRPDAFTKKRKDGTKAWKHKVMLALDRGLHYDLIATVEGMTSRFTAGDADPEDVRMIYANEVITDEGE